MILSAPHRLVLCCEVQLSLHCCILVSISSVCASSVWIYFYVSNSVRSFPSCPPLLHILFSICFHYFCPYFFFFFLYRYSLIWGNLLSLSLLLLLSVLLSLFFFINYLRQSLIFSYIFMQYKFISLNACLYLMTSVILLVDSFFSTKILIYFLFVKNCRVPKFLFCKWYQWWQTWKLGIISNCPSPLSFIIASYLINFPVISTHPFSHYPSATTLVEVFKVCFSWTIVIASWMVSSSLSSQTTSCVPVLHFLSSLPSAKTHHVPWSSDKN